MDFFELTQLLFNNHLLASEDTLNSVLHKYEVALQTNPEMVGLIQRPLKDRKYSARVLQSGDKRVGVIPVRGALTYQETGWEALCGMSSYEAMQGNAEYMIKEAKVDEILLELNSGGGQAYGCFEAAQAVRNLANEHGVNITTYVDGVAFSGGYAWACIADKVIMNPMAKVGSIGVVLPLQNTSERDKKEGIQRIYVTSGKSKVPFDKDGNYTQEALDDMQKQSQEIYEMFVEHVAANRGIDVKDVKDTEAKTFTATNALKLGLADEVMTKIEFYKHFEDLYGEGIMQVNSNPKSDEIKTPALVTQLNASLEQTQGDLKIAQDALKEKDIQINAHAEIVAGKDGQISTLAEQVKTLTDELAKVHLEAREATIKGLVPEDEVADVMSIAADMPKEKFDIYVKTLETKASKSRKEMEELGGSGKDVDEKVLSVDEQMKLRIKEMNESK